MQVEDIYDAIDLEDDKEAVRLAIIQSDIIELGPADMNATAGGYQSPKRARLNVNYSIGPAGELEKHVKQQQTFKQIKVQHTSSVQHIGNSSSNSNQQHHLNQQQRIVVQALANGNVIARSHSPKFQQITTIPQHSRRKMQLVNRIA